MRRLNNAPGRSRMGTLERMHRYEQGDFDHEETVDLFQDLIDSGLIWELQGSYGRTAERLLVTAKEE